MVAAADVGVAEVIACGRGRWKGACRAASSLTAFPPVVGLRGSRPTTVRRLRLTGGRARPGCPRSVGRAVGYTPTVVVVAVGAAVTFPGPGLASDAGAVGARAWMRRNSSRGLNGLMR